MSFQSNWYSLCVRVAEGGPLLASCIPSSATLTLWCDLWSPFKRKENLILDSFFLFQSKCSKFIKCACFHFYILHVSCQENLQICRSVTCLSKWTEENYPEEELKSKLGYDGPAFSYLGSILANYHSQTGRSFFFISR